MSAPVNARTLRTKRAVAIAFAGHGSGYVLSAYLLAGALLRRRRGPVRGADLRAVTTVLAIRPFFEWALHRFVLHAPAPATSGRRLDPGAAHRGHHQVPDDVSGALLGPGFALSNGVGVAVLAGAVGRLSGGPGGALAGAMTGELGLLGYEWIHLLSHSGYPPRSHWFRRLRGAHLRHHFRDEQVNFGVTSRLADRLLGTAA